MKKLMVVVALLGSFACSSQDIPPAHKGQELSLTGFLAFYAGGAGLSGPIVGPGTYFTGIYNEYRLVNCNISTIKEPMQALTKDSVQFSMDIYVRYSADCSDDSVAQILKNMSPDKDKTVSPENLYATYIRPSLGEAVRETISPVPANDVNDQREVLLQKIRTSFLKMIEVKKPKVVTVLEVNLSNMSPPAELQHAYVDRATQAVLKDKAIAERERVTAETATMEMRKMLSQKEGEVQAAKIDKIGEALRRNPQYLTYDMQSKMIEIYKEAGAKGNMIVAAPSPTIMITPK